MVLSASHNYIVHLLSAATGELRVLPGCGKASSARDTDC
jgi:hypothetical protein